MASGPVLSTSRIIIIIISFDRDEVGPSDETAPTRESCRSGPRFLQRIEE
jgi:hypothetical protein